MSELIIKNRHKSLEEIAKLPIVGQQPANEKEEKYLREIVEYEFYNLEEPGVPHTFSYGNTRNKHTFEFLHGGKYKIPRFIARHVESRSEPIWKYRPDGHGSIQKQEIGRKPRFRMSQTFN